MMSNIIIYIQEISTRTSAYMKRGKYSSSKLKITVKYHKLQFNYNMKIDKATVRAINLINRFWT